MKFISLLFLFLMITAAIPIVALAQAPTGNFCSVGGSDLVRIPCVFTGQSGPAGQQSFGTLVLNIIQIALLVVGSIAVLALIIGGFRYVTSFGDEAAAESGKKIIKNAVIGLVVVILSFAIITIITTVVITGRP